MWLYLLHGGGFTQLVSALVSHRLCSTLGPVSTLMDDRVRSSNPGHGNLYRSNQPSGSTHPGHPPWVGANEYWRWSLGHYLERNRRVLRDSRPDRL